MQLFGNVVHCTGAETESETESETGRRKTQSNTSLVWVVAVLLSFGVTVAVVVVFFCWCCYGQRRCPSACRDVMARRDVTSSAAVRRDLLQSLVSPPLGKRIFFMRNNILYASSAVPSAKVQLNLSL